MNNNPRTEAEWAEWNADIDRGLQYARSFFARFTYSCKRCGSEKNLNAYTSGTFRALITIKSKAWEMLASGREDLVKEFLDAFSAEVYCARCATRQVPSNGRWSAILEARLEEEKLAKENPDG